MKTMDMTERGFTLIELMIAMLISLIIAAAAIQLFQYSLNAVNRANEIQRSQQTLLATVEHLLPRIRQANTVTMTANPKGPSAPLGLSLTRNASGASPGHDCTGAPLGAGTEVEEFYYSDGKDLYCIVDGNISGEAPVAFDIVGFGLLVSYQDSNGDGRVNPGPAPTPDIHHNSGFPNDDDIIGVELEIEQSLTDGKTRKVPLHVALRNNTLAGRNEQGDFGP